MAYIGNTPAENYASFLTETFTVSATANYTLSHAVTNENEIRLVINGVVQQPGSGKAYTASGTTLTLSSATVSGDVMYAVYLGRALQTVNPPAASVGNSQTAPTIITGQTAETSIATDDTVLIHDTSAGALRKMTRANFVSGVGGDNTPAFQASFSGANSLSNSNSTILQYNTELFDTDSCYDTSTYTFTPTTAGKYFFYAFFRVTIAGTGFNFLQVGIQKNGSTALYHNRYHNDRGSVAVSGVLEANGSSDNFKAYGYHQRGSSISTYSDAGGNMFGAYKLIGV